MSFNNKDRLTNKLANIDELQTKIRLYLGEKGSSPHDEYVKQLFWEIDKEIHAFYKFIHSNEDLPGIH